jgi:hypothetical protein
MPKATFTMGKEKRRAWETKKALERLRADELREIDSDSLFDGSGIKQFLAVE